MKVGRIRNIIIPWVAGELAKSGNWSSIHPFLNRAKWVPESQSVHGAVTVHRWKNWHRYDEQGMVDIFTDTITERVTKIEWAFIPNIRPSRMPVEEEEKLREQQTEENRKPQEYGEWS